jgi:hypothetical protein
VYPSEDHRVKIKEEREQIAQKESKERHPKVGRMQ